MAAIPENPLPTRPKLHLKGGQILFVAPEDPIEACFSAPALKAIRNARPHATLAVLCSEAQRPLWEKTLRPNEVISFAAGTSARRLLPLFGDTPWESAFLWEAGAAAKAVEKAGIRQRIGYPAKKLAPHLTEPIHLPLPPGPVEHRVRHYLRLVEKLDIPAFVPGSFATPGARGPETGIRLAVVPSSPLGRNHEWPPERFAETLERLRENRPDVEISILADPANATPARAVAARLELEAVEAGEIGTLLAMLDESSLLFASDGLAPHLAAHLGLPAVAVFGPNDPDWKRPLGRQHTILRHKVECSPCLMPACPLDLRCQTELTVERASAALLAAVDRLTSGDRA